MKKNDKINYPFKNNNFIVSIFKVLFNLPRLIKQLVVVLIDISICLITVWLSFYLRLDEFIIFTNKTIIPFYISLLFMLPIFFYFNLYRSIFRFSGVAEIVLILKATLIYSIFFSSVITVYSITEIPRTIGLIQPILLFIFISLVRVFMHNSFNFLNQGSEDSKNTLIYGAGSAGRQLLSAINNSSNFKVIGFLDDDKFLIGKILEGKKIYHPEKIEEIVKKKKVKYLLLAISSINRSERNKILKKVSKLDIQVRVLPSIKDLISEKVTVSDLQKVDLYDLLGREEVDIENNLSAKLKDKIVLVTGAGGSIGREICKQVVANNPSKIILNDISEYALYKILEELENLIKVNSKNHELKPKLIPALISVQDKKSLYNLIKKTSPDIIYHAAAYKHVPLVENNSLEGIKNNVIGTYNVALATIELGVNNLVLISTDKAVRPTNIMGATKRLSEIILQSLNDYINNFQKIKPISKMCMVRFGNVLNSSGSVIPKFENQIKNGGPVTVTHKEIIRYFMTIKEASKLVIQAGFIAKGGEVFVLDMGKPIKIYELAKQMIKLSGLKLIEADNPDGDIDIKITGLRPGEKLYEELLIKDNPLPTPVPKIFCAKDDFIKWPELKLQIENLFNLLKDNQKIQSIEILKKLVPEYKIDK